MNKEKKDLLVFGYGLGVMAAVFGIGGLLRHGLQFAPVVLLACSVVFVSITALDWTALRPGYKGWMKVAHLIGMVVTTVILSAVFFLIFAPIGILFRIIGKDHLERRLDRAAKTYWHKRHQTPFSKERYQQQF